MLLKYNQLFLWLIVRNATQSYNEGYTYKTSMASQVTSQLSWLSCESCFMLQVMSGDYKHTDSFQYVAPA